MNYHTDENNYIGRATQLGLIQDGVWHFILATWNGLNSRSFHIYVDGIRVDNKDSEEGLICGFKVSESPLRIGIISGTNTDFDNPFHGAIDEVRMYERFFTEAEIPQVIDAIYSQLDPKPGMLCCQGFSVSENKAPNTLVGMLNIKNAFPSSIFDYSISDTRIVNQDLPDNSLQNEEKFFHVKGDSLLTSRTFDFEDQSEYVVQVEAQNQFHQLITGEINVNLNNVSDTILFRSLHPANNSIEISKLTDFQIKLNQPPNASALEQRYQLKSNFRHTIPNQLEISDFILKVSPDSLLMSGERVSFSIQDGELPEWDLFLKGKVNSQYIVSSNPSKTSISGKPEIISSHNREVYHSTTIPADIDNDGMLDLISTSSEDSTILYHHNLGNGKFSPPIIISNNEYAVRLVSPADFDDDGDLDLASTSIGDSTVSWFENRNNGSEWVRHHISHPEAGIWTVITEDIDADGDMDIVSASLWNEEIALFENDGEGVFNKRVLANNVGNAISVFAADLDSDNDLDIVFAGFWGKNTLGTIRNLSDGQYDSAQIITDTISWLYQVYPGDIDGDQDVDIVYCSRSENLVGWFENNGMGIFSENHIVSDSLRRPVSVHPADMNGDGNTDIITVSWTDSLLLWYENSGNGFFKNSHIVTDSIFHPQFCFAADIDHDGYLDILMGTDIDARWFQQSNVNLSPQGMTLSNNLVGERQNIITLIGTLSTIDNDDSLHSFTLMPNGEDQDNSKFFISNDSLYSNEVFDYETKSEYSIRVQTNDGHGGTFEKQFNIHISNLNEAPTALSLTSNSINENLPIGTFIGLLRTTDPDQGQTHSYQLVTGTGDADNANFSISNDSLYSKQVFDYETKSQYSIRVQTKDNNDSTFQKKFTIEVADIDEAPLDFWLTNNHVLVGTLEGTKFSYIQSNHSNVSYQIVDEQFTVSNKTLVCNKLIVSPQEYNISIKAIHQGRELIKNFKITAISRPLSSSFPKGKTIEDYRIISLPVESIPLSSGIIGLFENEHMKVWRVLKHTDKYIDLTYRDTLWAGKGYWIASDRPLGIDLNSGAPVQLHDSGYFEMNIKKGWNLIGNPFYSTLDWSQTVKSNIEHGRIDENDLPEILFIYKSAYLAETKLEIFEGAFIFSNKQVTLRLNLPTTSSPERQQSTIVSYYDGPENWQLKFDLIKNSILFNAAGIGIKSGHTTQQDFNDFMIPPAFGNRGLSMIESSTGLSKNIIGLENDYIWDFEVTGHGQLALHWNDLADLVTKKLTMILLPQQQIIDMKEQYKVSFNKMENQRLLVLLGNPDIPIPIQAKAYPNPSRGEVTVESMVIGSQQYYDVTLKIFEMSGALVSRVNQRVSSGGIAIFQINTGKTLDLKSGTYFYEVDYDNKNSQPKKLIIQK